jgi:hypothetical protein
VAFRMYSIERLWRVYPGTFRDRDGNVVTDVAVQAAIVPQRTQLSTDTKWVDVDYSVYEQPDANGHHGETSVLLAGPDADTTSVFGTVFRVPEGGGDLYLANPDTPELDVTFVERIEVE